MTAPSRVLLVEFLPRLSASSLMFRNSLAGQCLKAWVEADPDLRPRVEIEVMVVQDAQNVPTVVSQIAGRQPLLVGFTCYIWNILLVLEAVRELRRACPGVKIALGGPEASGRLDQTAEQSPDADFIACGEGEETLRELLRCLVIEDRGLDAVRGLAYRCDGRMIRTQEQPLIDLSRAPSPYQPSCFAPRREPGFSPMLIVESSRGCPFTCKFCEWGPRNLRYVPMERIRREFRLLAPHYEDIFLSDADIAIQRTRGPQLLEAFLEESAGTDCRLYVELNPAHLSRPFVDVLARAPEKFYLLLGLQTINEAAHERVARPFDFRKTEDSMFMLKSLVPNIGFKFSLIYGLPGDDFEGFRRTLDWCFRFRPDAVCPNHPLVLAGADFEKQAAELGLVYQDRPPYGVLETDTMGRTEMARARELAFFVFLLSFPLKEAFGILLDGAERVKAGPLGHLRMVELWIDAVKASGLARALAELAERPGSEHDVDLIDAIWTALRKEPLLRAACARTAQAVVRSAASRETHSAAV